MEEDQHVIRIWEVKKDRLVIMHQKLSDYPKLLSQSAGHSNCCIFRVPQSLIDINGRWYQPHIISIDPYHHGQPQLKMIEEHKWRFLGLLLKRTQSIGLRLKDYLKAVQPLEAKARECYSEIIHFGTDEYYRNVGARWLLYHGTFSKNWRDCTCPARCSTYINVMGLFIFLEGFDSSRKSNSIFRS